MKKEREAQEIYTITKTRARQKPKLSDIRETAKLMNDFHINIVIPFFPTLCQLLNWRKSVIDNVLEGSRRTYI